MNQLRFRRNVWPLLVWMVVTLVTQSIGAEQYALGRAGALILDAPREWKVQLAKAKKDAPPTITFTVASPTRAEALISPLWKKGSRPVAPDALRAALKSQGERMLKTAVETDIAMQEVQSESMNGYYYSLTDRAPKRGGYPVLTQGAATVGEIVIDFTVLSSASADARVGEMLQVLKSARHLAGVYYTYRCELIDMKFKIVLAKAAGLRVQILTDTDAKLDALVGESRIVAQPSSRGLDVSLTGGDLDKGDEFLKALMQGVDRL